VLKKAYKKENSIKSREDTRKLNPAQRLFSPGMNNMLQTWLKNSSSSVEWLGG
jgi:hypothetical protein